MARGKKKNTKNGITIIDSSNDTINETWNNNNRSSKPNPSNSSHKKKKTLLFQSHSDDDDNDTKDRNITSRSISDYMPIGLFVTDGKKFKLSSPQQQHSNNNNNSIHHGPTRIIITEQDADAMDIINDDVIMIVKLVNSNNDRMKRIGGIVMGKAQIWNQTPLPTTPRQRQQQTKILTAGYVHIIPSSVINDCFQNHLVPPKAVSGNTSVTATPSISTGISPQPQQKSQNELLKIQTSFSTTIATSPPFPRQQSNHPNSGSASSSSKNYSVTTPSPFSFKMGGGGDILYNSNTNSCSRKTNAAGSPSPAVYDRINRNKRNENTTTSTNNSTFYMMPIRRKNSLIQELVSKIVRPDDCTNIVLLYVPSSSSTITVMNSSKSNNILQRLVISHCLGRYIQVKEHIRISYQGQNIDFVVHNIHCNNNSTSNNNCGEIRKHDHGMDDTKEDNNNNILVSSIINDFDQKLSFQNSNPLNNTKDDHNNNTKNNLKEIIVEEEKQVEEDKDLVSTLINEYQGNSSNNNIYLYKMTYTTKIDFVWQNGDNETKSGSECNNNMNKAPLALNNSNQKYPSSEGSSNGNNSDNESQPILSSSSPRTMNQPKVEFVAGLDATISEIRSLLQPSLFHAQYFIERNIKPSKGILLYGPSGVGKTSLAKQIEYEYSNSNYDNGYMSSTSNDSNYNSNVQVQYVNCAAIQSKTNIVGEAERYVSKLFRTNTSTKNYNSLTKLLILDDVHLICPRRGGGGSGGSRVGTDRLASTLLALIDGAESTNGHGYNDDNNNSSVTTQYLQQQRITNIVILAITTNPSLLDPALRRPGRLDYEVEVPIPDEASTRAKIFNFHFNQFNVHFLPECTDEDRQKGLLTLASIAKGFNGADCMLAVKEAIRMAILRNHPIPSISSTAQNDDDEIIKSNNSNNNTLELGIDDLRDAIRTIHPSAIKSITVEIPKVLWSSIGGMDTVKRELREAIELPQNYSEYFKEMKVLPPRGILLYGPPGCSKTLMARALATESQMNFLAVKGPELLSKWLGESERALASLFRRARMASPSIIFFDEIDAIACQRGSGGDGGGSSSRLLSQLLTELDGINHGSSASVAGTKTKQQRVVVVGATNGPDLLDNALTRPGRIDRMIYVGVPDNESRYQIFTLSLENKSCSVDIDIKKLASDEMTSGFSGAEIVAICRDAALFALEEQADDDDENMSSNSVAYTAPMISMRHLTKACQSMQHQVTPEMLDFYRRYRETSINM